MAGHVMTPARGNQLDSMLFIGHVGIFCFCILVIISVNVVVVIISCSDNFLKYMLNETLMLKCN